MAGIVKVDDRVIDKPGTQIRDTARVEVSGPKEPFVSRAGRKLAAALDHFELDPSGLVCLDVGASTGGFTDCLLQHGAACVFAVDVGYGQLAWKLRQDRRVVVFERTNIRSLRPDMLEPAPDFAVIDASFVSLKGLLPPVMKLLPAQGCILALVKPQFEVGPGGVESGGIVRDERRYQEVFKTLISTVRSLGMHVAGILESPITGHKGNREFFIYLRLS